MLETDPLRLLLLPVACGDMCRCGAIAPGRRAIAPNLSRYRRRTASDAYSDPPNEPTMLLNSTLAMKDVGKCNIFIVALHGIHARLTGRHCAALQLENNQKALYLYKYYV